MSWYATIQGEVATSLKAYRMALKGFREWESPDSEGVVEIEKDPKSRRLFIRFDNTYRNLGRYVEHEVWKIARAYPKETTGDFNVWSDDGEFYSARLTVKGGKVYRQLLSEKAEEIRPYEMRPRDQTFTVMLSDREFRTKEDSRVSGRKPRGRRSA